MLARPALGAIWAYQRFVSPRKRFGCAYRLAHGGTGCSGFVKHAIARHGLWRTTPLIRARFAACNVAARTLNDTREDSEDGKRRESRWYDKCDCLLGCSPCGGAGKGTGKSGGDAGGADCTPDCTPDCCGG